MRKLLFIIILLSVGFLAFGQRENTLPLKALSSATDTIRVVIDNQSSLMLRSVLQGAIYDSLETHTDTLQALRADIDAGLSADLSDSITAHRLELNDLHDSITDHRIDIDANLDSIGVHRTELNNAVDSLAAHRTDINANTSTGSTNATNISTNSVLIGINTADIASLEDSIDKHTDTLQLHQTQIAAISGGDVFKVGTPVDNQIGVWTGDGTLEGDAQLTYNDGTTSFYVGSSGAAPSIRLGAGGAGLLYMYSDDYNNLLKANYTNTASYSGANLYWRYGGTFASNAAAPTNAMVKTESFEVYDGSSRLYSGGTAFKVDGSVSVGDFDVKYTWDLREGASSSTQVLELNANGLEYSADHSTDQAANDRWIPDKEYVDGVVITPYTFDSGLTEVAGNIDLGGALSADVDFTAASTYYFNIGSAASPMPEVTIHTDEQAQIRSVIGTDNGYVSVQSNLITMNYSGVGGQSTIGIAPSQMYILDNNNEIGLEYNADYSTNYTARSLPDSAHVASMVNLQFTGSLTDGAPTDAQIDSATGTTPAAVGAGWKCTILDSDGSALIYIIVSDGTNWQYTALTIAT